MATITTYYPGGYQTSAPQQNRREQWDTSAGYTAWDQAGSATAQRALTAQESANLTAQDTTATQDGNRQTLQTRAQAALTANTNFLAIASPTNAQTLAQVQTLTKECNALIRLLLGQLDSTSGT